MIEISFLTEREIADELDRIEREMREAVARSEGAVKEAMRLIEDLMDELGVPMAKESV